MRQFRLRLRQVEHYPVLLKEICTAINQVPMRGLIIWEGRVRLLRRLTRIDVMRAMPLRRVLLLGRQRRCQIGKG